MVSSEEVYALRERMKALKSQMGVLRCVEVLGMFDDILRRIYLCIAEEKNWLNVQREISWERQIKEKR